MAEVTVVGMVVVEVIMPSMEEPTVVMTPLSGKMGAGSSVLSSASMGS